MLVDRELAASVLGSNEKGAIRGEMGGAMGEDADSTWLLSLAQHGLLASSLLRTARSAWVGTPVQKLVECLALRLG